jgi:peptidyl-prolyl cis-trans isomerase SurA
LSIATVRVLQVLICLILSVLSLTSEGKTEIVDRIVAVVNDEIITHSELERYRRTLYPGRSKENDWLSEELKFSRTRRQALMALIDERLIDQEAERRHIKVTEEELEEAVESLKRQQGFSQSQLEQALAKENLTYENYRTEIAKSLKRRKLVNQAVRSKIETTEKDLRDYYEAHLGDYTADESIRISHILLPLAHNATNEKQEAVLSKAEEILTRIARGEDFVTLSNTYTKDNPGAKAGDLGYFKRGELIPAIEKSAFSLEVGQIAGPIQTPQGLVLIKLTERTRSKPTPFEETKEKVEQDYYMSELGQGYRQWVDKLKKKSFIEVKL